MTITAVLERPALALPVDAPSRPRRLTPEARLAALTSRRTALHAVDAEVRALLHRCLVESAAPSPLPPMVDLTVYDALYAAYPSVGGHWTVAMRRPSFGGLRIATYTVMAEFDGAHTLSGFRVVGATETASDNASLAVLERALLTVWKAGPQMTWAPAFMPGISL